jgi:hypothetical protein
VNVRPSLILDVAGMACIAIAAFIFHTVIGLAVLGCSLLVLSAMLERE